MLNIVAVAAGGAAGALARYGLTTLIHRLLGTGFPYGTLCVNVLGSLLLGMVFVAVERKGLGEPARLALGVGLLGAFTTFSTFSLDTLILLQQGQVVRAFVYVLLSVAVCLAAAAVGMLVMRAW